MTPTKPTTPSDAAHFLNRAAFGPKPGSISHVVTVGIEAYLAEQLAPKPDRPLSTDPARFRALGFSVKQMLDIYHGRTLFGRGMPEVMEQFQTVKVARAVGSPNQLREVLVDFWFNHFNVNLQHQFVRQSVLPYDRDAIRPNVLGKFGDLLKSTARHPAMLFYLDNYLSKRDTTEGGKVVRGLNENYGRELLELHTVGVNAGYTQQDVIDAARCFTGWTIDDLTTTGRFVFKPEHHDAGAKKIFGLEIPAGGGIEDGEKLLAYLAVHPATAKFVCHKLARRFVGDDPKASVVDRCASVFISTGGDLREVTRALLTAPEFWDSKDTPKFRTPFEYVVSCLRAVDARVDSAEPGLTWHFDNMGMRPFFCTPPTGWSDRGRDWQSSAHIYRLNFALDLGNNTIRGVKAGTAAALTAAGRSPNNSAAAAAFLNREVFGGGLSKRTMETASGVASGKPDTLAKVAGLILGSPEMQWR